MVLNQLLKSSSSKNQEASKPSPPTKKITNQDTEKMVNSTLQNIENKELEATLKKLAEDIFGR